MERFMFLTLVMIFVFSGIASADAIFNPDEYGIKDGRIYVSQAMVSFVGGQTVSFVGDPTNWQAKEGILADGFFSCLADSSYIFPDDKKVLFYCFTDNEKYLPYDIVGNLENQDDIIGSVSEGYNFFILPVFTPTVFDSTHYGIKDNQMFVSEEMVFFVGGSQVSFSGDPTGWEIKAGILENGFFFCPADSGYVFTEGERVIFYCVADNGKYLPGDIYANLADQNDAVDNEGGGYNFSVLPVLSGDISAVGDERPNNFQLSQNYPNPFNPATSINFMIPEPGKVVVDIQNITGQKIGTIIDEFMESGSHLVVWDGSGSPTGVYFCTLRAGIFSQTIKMTLIK